MNRCDQSPCCRTVSLWEVAVNGTGPGQSHGRGTDCLVAVARLGQSPWSGNRIALQGRQDTASGWLGKSHWDGASRQVADGCADSGPHGLSRRGAQMGVGTEGIDSSRRSGTGRLSARSCGSSRWGDVHSAGSSQRDGTRRVALGWTRHRAARRRGPMRLCQARRIEAAGKGSSPCPELPGLVTLRRSGRA